MFESFLQDVRIGLRVLFKEKSFCFLAVLVLALGIGGATTQFTVVNATVLRGFSFPHPEQLMSIGLIDPQASAQNNNFGLGNIPTAQDYEDLRAAQQSFAQMAGYLSGSTINVTYKNNPQRYTGAYITEDLFRIIGVSPIMGRDFTADDNKPGSEKVAILSHEIWKRDFNGDPNIVGQSVRINGKAATIIGVMPPNFKFPFSDQLWVPLYNEFPPIPRGQLAIRGALGATRWRIVRQMLTESFVVAAFGAVAGVLLAYWAVDLLIRATNSLPFPPPYWIQYRIDGPVLVFTVAITLVATIVSGLVPALVSSKGNAAEMMKEGGRGNSSRLVNIITRVLVVGQIALTAALLIAATLQIKSIRNQVTLDYGYDESAIYTARMGLMEGAYPTQDARRGFFLRAVRALRANPQFESAAMSDRFRMTFAGQGQYEVDSQNYTTDRDRPRGNFESVSDNYFATLGLKILEGRDFTIDDTDAKQPVAIVNNSFARKYYGNESPIGRRIRIYNPGQPQPWRTIVGVVPDTLMQGPFDQQTDTAGFYMPLLGAEPATQFCTIIVRPRPGQRADTLGSALGRAVAELDSNLPTYFAGTPARLHDEILGGNRIIATLFGIFGAVAFVLSAVGLYGVMSFSVTQRTQEFGIRMALGADAARIFRMVMTQGAWQLGIGLVLVAGGAALLLGVLAAAALQNILFKVNTLDPIIYCAVAGMLALGASVSTFPRQPENFRRVRGRKYYPVHFDRTGRCGAAFRRQGDVELLRRPRRATDTWPQFFAGGRRDRRRGDGDGKFLAKTDGRRPECDRSQHYARRRAAHDCGRIVERDVFVAWTG